jgi:hypothetical protein
VCFLVSAQIQPSCEAYLTATNDTQGNHGLLRFKLVSAWVVASLTSSTNRSATPHLWRLMLSHGTPQHAYTSTHIAAIAAPAYTST